MTWRHFTVSILQYGDLAIGNEALDFYSNLDFTSQKVDFQLLPSIRQQNIRLNSEYRDFLLQMLISHDP